MTDVDNSRVAGGEPDAADSCPPTGKEPVEQSPADVTEPPAADTLAHALTQKEEEHRALHDKYLRLYAELENYKKHVARERAEWIRGAQETILGELLPVVDNLERALAAGTTEADTAKIHEGIALIHKQCLALLSRFGVVSIQALGGPFDPAFHQAMGQIETDDAAEQTVMEEHQRGYRIDKRVLRPTMVSIAVRRKTDDVVGMHEERET